MNKNPEQKQKTRESMFDAFFKEYKERPMRNITVGAISKRAGVNRSTFYDYFTDIYDLLDQAQNSLLSELTSYIEQVSNMGKTEKLHMLANFGKEVLKNYGERIAALLGHGDTGFSVKLINTMKPRMKRVIEVDIDSQKIDLLIAFMLSGITGYITALYSSDGPFNVDESIQTLHLLMASLLDVFNDSHVL